MNNTENKFTNIADQLPITSLVFQLREKNPDMTFETLRDELNRRDDNNEPCYFINIKETDDLCILYYNDLPTTQEGRDPVVVELEKSCRSIILDKHNLKPIGSQFNRILYNSEAVDLLKTRDWNDVVVQKCYEGTMLLVFNHHGNWYVSTRRCINSEDSTWVRNKSYREMFDEAMGDKFSFDNLDKDLVYHFVLVHYKNKNIVNYTDLGEEYREIYHILTTEKYTMNEINYKIDGVNTVEEDHFDNLDSLLNKLNTISQENEFQRKITTEGYVLRIYDGDKYKSRFIVGKLQIEIYQTLMKMKPNNNNIYQSYLELYQKNKLTEFLPYFTKFNTEITKRIHTAMRNVAKEILDLYHCTRQKKNPQIYSSLTDQYKKVLYGLHGLYIQHRKHDFSNGSIDENKISKSINVHDVYHYIKSLPPHELRQIFYERTKLIENEMNTFINKNCFSTKVQCAQMFSFQQNQPAESEKNDEQSEEDNDTPLAIPDVLENSEPDEDDTGLPDVLEPLEAEEC